MLKIGTIELKSRLLLGTALYPSPDVLSRAVKAAGCGVVTVSLRRQSAGEGKGESFFALVRDLGVRVLPNTAGCRTVKEAITTAHMAREIFDTSWIKLELIGDDYTLQPDTALLVEAARLLVEDGFEVLPYTTEDLVVGRRLLDVGCKVLMPWGSPIGSGQGLLNPFLLRTLRTRLPDVTLIVDAGIGKPSEAAAALEMGFDGVLLNSAVALAGDPVKMATAFARAVEAGRLGHEAGLMDKRDTARPTTPTLGTPFWQESGETS
jgi:thiazole synthase